MTRKLLIALIISWLCASLITVSPAAAAGSITVHNRTDKTARMAFVYWHPEFHDWVLDAWFRVAADSSIRIKKPVGSTIYWYAEAWVAGRLYYWPDQGSQDRFWTVVNSKMFAEIGEEVEGQGARRVGFDMVKGPPGCQSDCTYTITLK